MRAISIVRQHHRSAILWVRATVAGSHGVLPSAACRQHDRNIEHSWRHHSVLASKPQEDNNKGAVVPSSDDSDLPCIPIDFELSAKIEGEESHIATIKLLPGEKLRAESGAMLYMTDGVEMETTMQGMSSAFSRMMTGQNFFFTDFVYSKESGSGTVCLGTDFPSKILRFNLGEMPDNNLICQKGAYLASNPSINIEIEFTRSFSAGFFGGEGFVLQKLSGEGDVLVKGGGTIVSRTLKEGEVLRATSGSLVAFESTVSYDVQMVQGIRNAIFGGEGLFITSLTGPGAVWLQGMPSDRMIAEIARRVPSGSGIGLGVPIGVGGGGSEGAGDAGAGVAAASAADEVGAGAAMGESSSATSGALAAEEAVEADRNATVATTGIDSESPSALFGDAAPKESPTSLSDASLPNENSFYSENDDSFTTDHMDEPAFRDENAFDSASNSNINDGELFDDISEAATPNVDDGDSSGGLFQTVWDLFSGDDGD